MPGDIKYKDINGDGIIDINDEVPIGYPTTPEIIYGFGVSSTYKNFDLSFFFQGSARSSFFIDAYRTSPFIDTSGSAIGNNALLNAWANDHWSENDRNLYAAWPRLSDQLIDNNNRNSTWWLRDGGFLRLKSLEIGSNFVLQCHSWTSIAKKSQCLTSIATPNCGNPVAPPLYSPSSRTTRLPNPFLKSPASLCNAVLQL